MDGLDTHTESLANYLLDNFDITKVNQTHLWMDSAKISRKQFLDQHLKIKVLKAADCIEILDLPRSEQDSYYKKVFDTMGSWLYEEAREKYNSPDLPRAQIDRSQLIPVLDVKTNEVLLFNNHTKSISEMDYRAWERKLSKEDREVISYTMRDALLVYDPYHLETFVTVGWEGMEVLKVNTYVPPTWRLLAPPKRPECPEIIWDVLTHLFPNPLCLEFVLNWMYTALVARNETYLLLNGKKGIGKGIFETLMAAMVGREHYTVAPTSLLTTQFNAAIDRKRLIVMDEFKIGKSEHTRLKRFINKYQSIEKKGVDADKAKETYNSYVIQNNDISDNYLEWDDRRFSVPDLTDERLETVLHKDDIEWLSKELEQEDSELVKAFGYFVFNQGSSPRFHEFSIWQGQRFWGIVYNSLKEWQRFIADKIFNTGEESYAIGQLAREFGKDANLKFSHFPRNYKRVQDFLDNYLHDGEYRLGTVEKEDGEYVIKTDERWIQEEEDDQLSFL